MKILLIITTLLIVAILYIQAQNYEAEAEEYKQQAIEFEASKDYELAVLGYENAGKCYRQADKTFESTRMFSFAAQIYQILAKRHGSEDNHSAQAKCYKSAAGCCKEAGLVEKAKELYIMAIDIFEKLPIDSQYYHDLAHSYKAAADCFKELEDTNKANEMLAKAAKWYELEGSHQIENNDYSNAIPSYRSASKCYSELENTSKTNELHHLIAELEKQSRTISFIIRKHCFQFFVPVMIIAIIISISYFFLHSN